MKKTIIIFTALVLPLILSAQSPQKIKAAEISFVFDSKDVDGSIDGVDSSSSLDLENPANSSFKGSVEVSTIKTGNFIRDWSLKGGKYFDADEHPKITFESTSVSATEDGFLVKGALTIKGKTKSISWQFKKNGDQLTGTTTLFSSDFGIFIKKKREDNKVSVKMVLHLQG